MTPDEIADAMTAIEADIEKLIARTAAMVPAVNGLARELNIKGMKVRACECGEIDLSLGHAIEGLTHAVVSVKEAHCCMIKKAAEAPIPLPAPRSGR